MLKMSLNRIQRHFLLRILSLPSSREDFIFEYVYVLRGQIMLALFIYVISSV